jgi:ribosomal protein S18 acetylase RimI-like enzyme
MADDAHPVARQWVEAQLAGHRAILPYRARVHTIRVMTLDDVEVIGTVQARAFVDDPLQMWAIPDDGARLGLLEQMFTVLGRAVNVPGGDAYTDAGRDAAAFWVAPGSYDAALPAEAATDLAALGEAIGPDVMRRLGAAHEAMHAAHPREPHWYLQGIGTDPPARRRGLASALIRVVTERADRDAVPCYLESTKAENVGLYEHHGFTVTGTLAIPGGGPTLWTMWRNPQAQTSS